MIIVVDTFDAKHPPFVVHPLDVDEDQPLEPPEWKEVTEEDVEAFLAWEPDTR